MEEFNFIEEPPNTLTDEDNKLSSIVKMSPRQLASSILEVYQKLGGTSWLMTQAQVDPKAFFELLKKILPTNIKLDGLEGLNVSLITAYVNSPLAIKNQENNANIIDLEDHRKGLRLMTVDANNKEEYKKIEEYVPDVQIATGGNQAEDGVRSLLDDPSICRVEEPLPVQGVTICDRYSSDGPATTPTSPDDATSGNNPEFEFE